MVGWSLLAAVEQTRARAELDARSNARELARAMIAALRAPSILDQAPAAARFAVHGGALQIPDDVGWLFATAPLPTDAVVAEKLRQAQLDEFAREDAAAAQKQFDDLLGPQGPAGDAALPVVAAAAWQAQRCGACERAGELAARLAAAFDAAAPARLADPTLANSLAAATLLDAAMHRPRTQFVARLLPALPSALAQATLTRMYERGEDTAALAATAANTAARRNLLTTIANLQTSLPTTPLAANAAGRLLLWFPKGDKNGDGALLPPAFLQQLRSTVPGRGDLLFATPPADADEVIADLAWIAPEPLPPPSLLARPAAVIGATSLLVLVFAASAFFMVRALRREALAMRARAEFLTGVTHELKTPVASIRLMAEVLTGDEVPPRKQREYFALLAGESARLSMLIENVLDLGQMERGERAYDPRPCDAAAVVREAVTLFAPLAQRSGLRLELHSDDAPAPATLDAGACVQALLNLLDNARKYAAEGQRIEVTTSRDAHTFAIHVRDFGPGIPATEREAIFERFARGSAHRHGSIPGVGLGLHLSRAIVQRHGGTLSCDAPANGPGARFTLTLPLDPEPAP